MPVQQLGVLKELGFGPILRKMLEGD
jgi:hypothetical protein